MTLPAIAILVVLLLHMGGFAADMIRVQHVARDAARAFVLDVSIPVESNQDVRFTGPSRDGLVTATVRLRSRWLSRFGNDVWLTGRATMMAEP